MFEPEGITRSDGLTGLSNRRAGLEHLAVLVEKGMPFSLLMVDVDDFKQVNGMTFHARGDRMLQRTAETLRALFPDPDATFRYGGDEFVVVLPGVDRAAAVDLAEHVCAAVAAIAVPDWDHPGERARSRLTCSLGVAGYPANGHSRDEVLRAADHAMYRAKRDGGGRVRTSTSLDDQP